MNRKVEKQFLSLFEKKGKYKSTTTIFSIISIFFLVIDIVLCVINFPYVRPVFNISILLSLISIIIYVIFEHKLENVQKYILYLENKNILDEKNINRCLKEKEIIKIKRKKEKYQLIKEKEIKLINKIPLNTLIELRECLEMNNEI